MSIIKAWGSTLILTALKRVIAVFLDWCLSVAHPTLACFTVTDMNIAEQHPATLNEIQCSPFCVMSWLFDWWPISSDLSLISDSLKLFQGNTFSMQYVDICAFLLRISCVMIMIMIICDCGLHHVSLLRSWHCMFLDCVCSQLLDLLYFCDRMYIPVVAYYQ